MPDRIRSVHSTSCSRTRAPTLQFGRTFKLLRPRRRDHELVITSRSAPRIKAHPQAHNIDTFPCNSALYQSIADFLPNGNRIIPFLASLWTTTAFTLPPLFFVR